MKTANSSVAEERKSPIRNATILVSLGITASALVGTLSDDSVAVFAKVFGSRPSGIPLRGFLGLVVLALSLPVPLGAWHAFRIWFRGQKDPGGVRGFGFLGLLAIPERHPDLKFSRAIALAVFGFYLTLMAAWIVYADSRGI